MYADREREGPNTSELIQLDDDELASLKSDLRLSIFNNLDSITEMSPLIRASP